MKPEDLITFGKFKGLTWDEASDIDPGYVVWAVEEVKGVDLPVEFVDACRRDALEDDWGMDPEDQY